MNVFALMYEFECAEYCMRVLVREVIVLTDFGQVAPPRLMLWVEFVAEMFWESAWTWMQRQFPFSYGTHTYTQTHTHIHTYTHKSHTHTYTHTNVLIDTEI